MVSVLVIATVTATPEAAGSDPLASTANGWQVMVTVSVVSGVSRDSAVMVRGAVAGAAGSRNVGSSCACSWRIRAAKTARSVTGRGY